MPKQFGNPFLLLSKISKLLLNIRMRYGGSKLKKRGFCGIFNHLNGVKSKYKGLPIEITIGSCYLES